ncbi:MAG: hypothetical protein HF300_09670 [Ignavibacteria bacterium]|jgi:uncharacterized protein YciI|nr:hypothetical protein [Ignavibacteria bacterium]MCU7500658.1 hypothetical protein [Ignavibacteria bacterium]MCU7512816.1 hypothetical protein [Ignavibacteria bacterium]MCU7521773.1 hypothetical protein [Ignavibacteria bacterium]MCU7526353.1 hypothetical protein [Ignavibacteria bacterium]
MKFFVCEIIYKAPLDQIEAATLEHRTFLRTGYDKGFILLSGPQVPRTGGIVIVKGESMEEVAEFFSNDPYKKKGLAEHTFIEFSPKNYQDFVKGWVE